MMLNSNSATCALILGLSVVLLTACGGGGSSSEATGTFTLAITDATIDDYDEALLEVSSITLIGAGGQETEVLETPQIIDLLKLRNVSELLLRESLTARSISKIRLGVESITLNKLDAAGLIVATDSPPVPTRKIDLNPQGSLEIRAGEDLLVVLDVDLANSIKVNATGNGQVRFRPLVKISAEVSGLVRLYGSYTVDGTSTSICDLERVSDADGTYEVLDVCIALDETSASYFGMDGLPLVDGEPQNSGDLTDGNKVSVYGYYESSASGQTLNAEIIARGNGTRGGAFMTVYGTVFESWGMNSSRFTLALTDTTTIPIELSDGAKVFDLEGAIVSTGTYATRLVPQHRVEARGAFTDSGSAADPDWIQAFVAFIADAEGSDELNGTIAGIEENLITLNTVNPVNPGLAACITTSANTEFYSIDVDGDITETSRVQFSDLMDGDEINASGDQVGECLQATTVIREITTNN